MKEIVLVPLEPNNANKILDIRNSSDFLKFCTNRQSALSLEEFIEELEEDFSKDRYCQYIIEVGDVVCGTIWAYGYIANDGYLYTSLYIGKEFRRTNIAARCLMNFGKLLFNDIPTLFKIYLDVYEYNSDSLRPLRKFGLHEEGVFRKQKRIGDQRYDVIRFAFYRDELSKLDHYKV